MRPVSYSAADACEQVFPLGIIFLVGWLFLGLAFGQKEADEGILEGTRRWRGVQSSCSRHFPLPQAGDMWCS